MSYGYRFEEYGVEHPTNIYAVIYFELFELGNSDILQNCIKYSNGLERRNKVIDEVLLHKFKCYSDRLCALVVNGTDAEFDSNAKMPFVYKYVDYLRRVFDKNFESAVWLCASKSLALRYAKNLNGELITVHITHSSSTCISDLGIDGSLYAFVDLPEVTEKQAVESGNIIN